MDDEADILQSAQGMPFRRNVDSPDERSISGAQTQETEMKTDDEVVRVRPAPTPSFGHANLLWIQDVSGQWYPRED